MKKFLLTSLIAIVAFCLVTGSGAETRISKFESAFFSSQNLQDGDIVVRSGKGFISDVFRNTSRRERKYSHAGLVVIRQGRPYVIHVIGHEGNTTNGDLREEPIERFCSSEANLGYAIYRCGLNAKQKDQLNQLLSAMQRSHLKFDDHFDLKSNEAMYCSEFISKMLYRSAGICFPVSHIGNSTYIGVDDLYLNSFTCKIAEFKYKS